MKTKPAAPGFSLVKGSDLSLSGPAFVALLRAVLQKASSVRFQAKGFSMAPFIKNADVLTVCPLKHRLPGLGDIIAFVHKETGGLCIHRIVGREKDFYITQGDNLSESAEHVTREDILGCVTRVERGSRSISWGLGPERYVIAFLGRRGLLFPLLLPVWKALRPFIKRTEE